VLVYKVILSGEHTQVGRALVPQQSLDPILRTLFTKTLVRFVITKNFSTIIIIYYKKRKVCLNPKKSLFITQSMVGFISENNIVSEDK
jgi:hypothetical protein